MLAVFASGCGSGDQPPEAKPAGTFSSADVSVSLPAGWRAVQRPVTHIISPKQIFAATNVPPDHLDWHGLGGCSGRRPPAGVIVVWVLEYDKVYPGSPRRPPGELEATDSRTGNFECLGHGTEFHFRRGGRLLQAEVSYRAGRLRGAGRREVLAMLNSLEPR
jgi:hypothetical protein